MESSNKWKTDFQKGKQRRTKATNQLNRHLTGTELIRRHEHLKTMRIGEKVKNNNYKNRNEKVNFLHAMGLDYLLTNKPTETPVLIRFSDDPGFYIKVPSECSDNAKRINEYLKTIQHYQVLFVQRKNGIIRDRYYGLVSLSSIVQNCKYHLSSTKGNKNRLQFQYSPVKKIYIQPEERTLFSENLVKRINNLN